MSSWIFSPMKRWALCFLFIRGLRPNWWIGFDTGHCFDGHDEKTARELFKDYPETLNTINQTKGIRMIQAEYPAATLEYCEEQCRGMVEQIIKLST